MAALGSALIRLSLSPFEVVLHASRRRLLEQPDPKKTHEVRFLCRCPRFARQGSLEHANPGRPPFRGNPHLESTRCSRVWQGTAQEMQGNDLFAPATAARRSRCRAASSKQA